MSTLFYGDHELTIFLLHVIARSKSEVDAKHKWLLHQLHYRAQNELRTSFFRSVLYMARPKMDAMDSIDNAMLMDDAKLHRQLKRVFLQKHLQLQSIVDQ